MSWEHLESFGADRWPVNDPAGIGEVNDAQDIVYLPSRRGLTGGASNFLGGLLRWCRDEKSSSHLRWLLPFNTDLIPGRAFRQVNTVAVPHFATSGGIQPNAW